MLISRFSIPRLRCSQWLRRGATAILALVLTLFSLQALAGGGKFANPLVAQSTADPWIVWHKGYYYFTFTGGGRIEIWKSPTLAGFRESPGAGGVETKVVWEPGEEELYRFHVWAPELHFVEGRWYIYYTAATGPDETHRLFVLQGDKKDPLGPYGYRYQITFPREDYWAIDGTIFRHKKSLYLLWSGWNNHREKRQKLYIAAMQNPWTVRGERHLISEAEHAWEKDQKDLNEGPEVLKSPDGKRLFVVYSASFYRSPAYCLGMLTYTGGNILDRASWRKSPQPVFSQYHSGDVHVYGPGHNGFFKSPNGKEDWMVYHARDVREFGNGDPRTARAQRVNWNADGTPDFGHPVPPGELLPEPAGTRLPAMPAARIRPMP